MFGRILAYIAQIQVIDPNNHVVYEAGDDF